MTLLPRKICYLSGTRADFGLMQSTLASIAAHQGLSLDVVVTGAHLAEKYGLTVKEIESAGFHIAARIPIDAESSTGAAMARNLAGTLNGCVTAFEAIQPDVVLLLGDRGEMLAGALAAIHLNIPIAHIHGGERSGTVDEPIRHAISKLAHWHFVSTEASRDRLVRMGEHPECVFVTGAPGLDGLAELPYMDRHSLCADTRLDPARPLALLVYHPVLQEIAGEQTATILETLLEQSVQIVCLMPNSDAGNEPIRNALLEKAIHKDIRLFTHLPRPVFVSWMAACNLMLGNSSSGIIEAATFGTPVINIGSRQNLRERNTNTVDAPVEPNLLIAAIRQALENGRYPAANIYGDGNASGRICQLLSTLSIDAKLLCKTNAY